MDFRVPFLIPQVATDGHTFRFLNETVSFDSKINWKIESVPRLWGYNLHYFEYLEGMAVDQGRVLVEDWIAENRDPLHWGWDPYPLSLRLVQWMKWLARHGENAASQTILESLWAQAEYLAHNFEHHIQGNHLFENAKTLVWAGLTFLGSESEAWLRLGGHQLLAELEEQILPDGAHYELSPMYHSIILEGCLDLLNFGPRLKALAPSLEDALKQRVPGMLSWLSAMCHPDGEISLLNDSATRIAPSPSHLFAYGEALGFTPSPLPQRCHLASSGYVVAHQHGGEDYLVMDVGHMGPPHQPGHSHCDLLSFELSLGGRRIIVDSGVFAYQDTSMRRRNRETAGHNTLRIDGRDQSEIWGNFRVARRAEPIGVNVEDREGKWVVRGGHTGYEPIGVRHHREWTWGDCELAIMDSLEGAGSHEVETFFHFHPSLQLKLAHSQADVLLEGRCVARIILPESMEYQIIPTRYHPEFGLALENVTLVLSTTVTVPAHFECRFIWNSLANELP